MVAVALRVEDYFEEPPDLRAISQELSSEVLTLARRLRERSEETERSVSKYETTVSRALDGILRLDSLLASTNAVPAGLDRIIDKMEAWELQQREAAPELEALRLPRLDTVSPPLRALLLRMHTLRDRALRANAHFVQSAHDARWRFTLWLAERHAAEPDAPVLGSAADVDAFFASLDRR